MDERESILDIRLRRELTVTEKLQQIYQNMRVESTLGLNAVESFIPTNFEYVSRNGQKHSLKVQEIFRDSTHSNKLKTSSNSFGGASPSTSTSTTQYVSSDLKRERILLEGEAGVGKTSVSREILSLWSKAQFFNDKFEFVFRIPLRLLEDTSWRSSYNADQMLDPVICFIHHAISLINTDKKLRISFEELRSIFNHEGAKENILVVVDGYDIVANEDENNPFIKHFIQDIFDTFKYIFMTTRPNFMSVVRYNQFDTKITARGFDDDGIEAFIGLYFNTRLKTISSFISNSFVEREETDIRSIFSDLFRTTKKDEFELLIELQRVVEYYKKLSESKFEPTDENSVIQNYFKDKETILNSINEYFIATKTLLHDILTRNPHISDFASIPMHTEMLCLISSDPWMQHILSDNVSIGLLYKSVLVLFSQRLENLSENAQHGFKGGDVRIEYETLLTQPLFKVLKELAYKSAFECNNVLGGAFINEVASKHGLTIHDIYRSSILKIVSRDSDNTPKSELSIFNIQQELNPNDLYSRSYVFSHQSLGEFLAAVKLRKMLTSDDETIYKEAAYRIAYNRNDPHYSMLFKFLAGKLRDLTSSAEVDRGIIRFWEAATCNIEGVLEIGNEKKVIFLMHLLSQTQRKDGHYDPRIPNLETMQKYIDAEIIKNMAKYLDAMKSSQYLSPTLESHIWGIFQQFDSSRFSLSETSGPMRQLESLEDLTSSMEVHQSRIFDSFYISKVGSSESPNRRDNIHLKLAIDLAASALGKIDNQLLFDALVNIVRGETNWEIKKSALSVIIKIIKFHYNSEFLFLHKDVPLEDILIGAISNQNIRDISVEALGVYINIKSHNHEFLLEVLQKLLFLVRNEDRIIELNNFITQIIAKLPESMHEQAVVELLKLAEGRTVISTPLQRDTSDENEYVVEPSQDSLMEIIENIVGINDAKLTDLLIDNLIKLVSRDLTTQGYISSIMGKILTTSDNVTKEKIFTETMEGLSGVAEKTKIIDNINLLVLKGEKISPRFTVDILNKLISFLETPEIGGIQNKNIANAIIKVIRTTTDIEEGLRKEIFDKLFKHIDLGPEIILACACIVPRLDYNLLTNLKKVIYDNDTFDNALIIHQALIELSNVKIYELFRRELFHELAMGQQKSLPVLAAFTTNLSFLSEGQVQEIKVIAADLLRIISRDNFKDIIPIVDGIIQNLSNKNDIIELILSHLDMCSHSINLEHKLGLIKLITSSVNNYEVSETTRERLLHQIYPLIDLVEVQDIKIFARYAAKFMVGNSHDRTLVEYLTSGSLKHNIFAATAIGKILKHRKIDSEMDISAELLSKFTNNISESTFFYPLLQLLTHRSEDIDLQKIKHELLTIYRANHPVNHAEEYTASGYLAYLLSQSISIHEQLDDKILSRMLMDLRQFSRNSGEHIEHGSAFSASNLGFISAQDVNNAMVGIIHFMSFDMVVKLLNRECPIIRKSAVNDLIERIVHQKFSGDWSKDVVNLLKIVGNHIQVMDDSQERLYDLTRRALQDLALKLDAEEVNLNYVIDNFRKLILLSAIEAENFMKGLFFKVLSDNMITEAESKFIVLCINRFGFTLTIKVNHSDVVGTEVEILYEGITYKLSGKDNKQYIEDIVNEVQQRALKIPLVFVNTGSAIPIASADILKKCSIVDGSEIIRGGELYLSFLYASDVGKASPQRSMLLIESFDKIYKVTFNEASTTFKTYDSTVIDLSLRKEIFGEMQYPGEEGSTTSLQPRYFIKSFYISEDQRDSILELVVPRDVIEMFDSERWTLSKLSESSHHLGYDSEEDAVYQSSELYERIFILLRGNSAFADKISFNWLTDIDSGFIEYRRDQLLLIDRERSASNKFILNSFNKGNSLTAEEHREMSEIYHDPFKLGLYISLKLVFNSVYTAVESIKSGKVSDQDIGILGGVSNAVDAISSMASLPVISTGLTILSQILQGVGESLAASANDNIAHFSSSEKVRTLFESIARKLALKDFSRIDFDPTILGQASSTLLEVANGGLSAIVSMVTDLVIEQLDTKKEDPEFKRGEAVGEIIGRKILAHIAKGEYFDLQISLYKSGKDPEPGLLSKVVEDITRDYFKGVSSSDTASISSEASNQGSSIITATGKNGETKSNGHSPLHSEHSATSIQAASNVENQGDASPLTCWQRFIHCLTHPICYRVEVDNGPVLPQGYPSFYPANYEYKPLTRHYKHVPVEQIDFSEVLGTNTDYTEITGVIRHILEKYPYFVRVQVESKGTKDDSSIAAEEIVIETNLDGNVRNNQVSTMPTALLSEETHVSSLNFWGIFEMSDLLNPRLLLKKVLYPEEIGKMLAIFKEKNLEVDISKTSAINKALAKGIHSDKGGSDSDSKSVLEAKEKLSQTIYDDLKFLFEGRANSIGEVVKNTQIGFKVLDTGVDAGRLILKQEGKYIAPVLMDLNYLYSFKFGPNKYSYIISVGDIMYKLSQGEIYPALYQASSTAAFMALPVAVASVGGPTAALAYSGITSVYLVYGSLKNARAFVGEVQEWLQNLEYVELQMGGETNSTSV